MPAVALDFRRTSISSARKKVEIFAPRSSINRYMEVLVRFLLAPAISSGKHFARLRDDFAGSSTTVEQIGPARDDAGKREAIEIYENVSANERLELPEITRRIARLFRVRPKG
jgi:hypothetical protein